MCLTQPTHHLFAWTSSLGQSRPFDILVVPFWSMFSKGAKRLAFYFWVLWATECNFTVLQCAEQCFSRADTCSNKPRPHQAPQQVSQWWLDKNCPPPPFPPPRRSKIKRAPGRAGEGSCRWPLCETEDAPGQKESVGK